MKLSIIPALLTPMTDGKSDKQALRQLVDKLINDGVSGFFAGGSTAEAFMMSTVERMELLEVVADQTKGRVPIIAHIGSIGTELTLELGKHAVGVSGVTAVSSIPPFYYKFNKEEIVGFYLDLAEGLGTPVLPYNFPKLSGVTLSFNEIESMRTSGAISGLKFTSSDFFDLNLIKTRFPELPVYNGFDELYLSGLAMGADGAIGSTFNFMAGKFIRISDLFTKGKLDEARILQTEANEVIKGMQKPRNFMAAQKYMVELTGVPCGNPRKPFLPLNNEEKRYLKELTEKYLQKGDCDDLTASCEISD